jgi:hypothetical protein
VNFARCERRSVVDGEVVSVETGEAEMSSDPRFRRARRRAASELLIYVDHRSPTNELELLDAAHDLDAVADRWRLEHGSRRGRATELLRLAGAR